MELKEYVKPNLVKKFEKFCEKNSKDFYSCGCILTAHIVMKALMRHKDKEIGLFKPIKLTPKESWEKGMRVCPEHSGASAAVTATIIARYSPRGEEFKKWCIKDDVVMVNWFK